LATLPNDEQVARRAIQDQSRVDTRIAAGDHQGFGRLALFDQFTNSASSFAKMPFAEACKAFDELRGELMRRSVVVPLRGICRSLLQYLLRDMRRGRLLVPARCFQPVAHELLVEARRIAAT